MPSRFSGMISGGLSNLAHLARQFAGLGTVGQTGADDQQSDQANLDALLRGTEEEHDGWQPPTTLLNARSWDRHDIGQSMDSPFIDRYGETNPWALYYSPDQMVDERGQIRGGMPETAPFRGIGAMQMAHGYRPEPIQVPQSMPMGGGGSAGGARGAPFNFSYQRPEMPQFQQAPQRTVDMQDPMPPAPRPEAPEPHVRDAAKFEKLLGI